MFFKFRSDQSAYSIENAMVVTSSKPFLEDNIQCAGDLIDQKFAGIYSPIVLFSPLFAVAVCPSRGAINNALLQMSCVEADDALARLDLARRFTTRGFGEATTRDGVKANLLPQRMYSVFSKAVFLLICIRRSGYVINMTRGALEYFLGNPAIQKT